MGNAQYHEGLLVISEGLCYQSVCVPKDWSPEQVEASVSPSGTTRGWKISEDPQFRGGQPNPCPCDLYPKDRMHYLMDC